MKKLGQLQSGVNELADAVTLGLLENVLQRGMHITKMVTVAKDFF